MRPIFIVLSTPEIGGMEKRLAGLFLHLASEGKPVGLVATEELIARLEKTAECRALAAHRSQVVPFDAGREESFGRLKTTLRGLRRRHPEAIFHYGLVSPLRIHWASTRRTLYTIPNSSLRQYNARGLVEVFGGVLRSSRVDVLDPHVYRQLRASFFWRRHAFSNTPGSFVDLDVFRPLPANEKRNRIVFSGLFTHEKQAPRLAAALPRLLERLDRAGLPDTEIWMLGRESAGGVTESVNRLGNPRVRAFHSSDPRETLRESKVFLSLQRSTNHPSKALLEAMASGCAPVVTDVRDSTRTAPRALARYVPRDFSADDLADACVALLRRSEPEIDRATAAMRAHLQRCFSITAMAEYYWRLYASMDD